MKPMICVDDVRKVYSPEVNGHGENPRLPLPDGEELMAFTKRDQKEIEGIVSAETHELKSRIEKLEGDSEARRSFWRFDHAKDYLAVISPVIVFIGIVYALGDFKGSTSAKIAGFDETLKHLDKRLERLEDKVYRSALVAPTPIKSDADVNAIREAADYARKRRLGVPPETIRHIAGQLLVDSITPAKWQAVTALVGLRSSVNAGLEEAKARSTVRIGPNDAGKWVDYTSGYLLFEGGGSVALDGDLSDQQLGRALFFDRPGDRTHFRSLYKHIVFRNTNIVITGKRPITLIDVYFEDCTFELPNTPLGQSFAEALIEDPQVTFKS